MDELYFPFNVYITFMTSTPAGKAQLALRQRRLDSSVGSILRTFVSFAFFVFAAATGREQSLKIVIGCRGFRDQQELQSSVS